VNPTYDFSGRVAFVTGASSGMGLATARAFTEAGAAVTLVDVDDQALHAADTQLRDAGHRILAVHCDVADEAQVAAAVGATVEAFGSLDMATTMPVSKPRPPMPPTSPPRCSIASMPSICAVSGPA